MEPQAIIDAGAELIRAIPRSGLLVATVAALLLGWIGSAMLRREVAGGRAVRTLSTLALVGILVTVFLQIARFDPRLEYAIAALVDAGHLTAQADADLRLLSRILVTMRLVAPDSNEPPQRSRALVATLCGHASWDKLLAAHHHARQRIADLWASVRTSDD